MVAYYPRSLTGKLFIRVIQGFIARLEFIINALRTMGWRLMC